MNKSTSAASCPMCHSARVAPVTGVQLGLGEVIWRKLTSQGESPKWFCRDCGHLWNGPLTPCDPVLEERVGAVELMTVSFAGLEGSGGLGECLSARDLVEVLNLHFSLQAEAVRERRGCFDKIFDMAVQAFWGPPFTGEDEASLLACQAALGQLRAMDALRAGLPGLPQVHLSIGISTGRVVAGNLGPEGSRSYSVIGDTVDLGQRLQRANRLYGTYILMNGETCERVGTVMVTREIDLLMVKGRKDPVRIFELLGGQDEVSGAKLLLRDKFSVALDAYRRREWSWAETALQACLEISPNDGPSRLFLERCRSESLAKDTSGMAGR